VSCKCNVIHDVQGQARALFGSTSQHPCIVRHHGTTQCTSHLDFALAEDVIDMLRSIWSDGELASEGDFLSDGANPPPNAMAANYSFQAHDNPLEIPPEIPPPQQQQATAAGNSDLVTLQHFALSFPHLTHHDQGRQPHATVIHSDTAVRRRQGCGGQVFSTICQDEQAETPTRLWGPSAIPTCLLFHNSLP
jgi:hypothetical protein